MKGYSYLGLDFNSTCVLNIAHRIEVKQQIITNRVNNIYLLQSMWFFLNQGIILENCLFKVMQSKQRSNLALGWGNLS